MIRTKVTRTSALTRFVPAGKLSHAHRSFLPMLALCLATAAWSQSTPGPKGLHRPAVMPGAIPGAKLTADAPASAQYRFITLDVPPSSFTQAAGINNARLVSGFYEDASDTLHGFIWQNGAFQTADYPGGLYTYLGTVNNYSVALGYYGDGTAEHTVTYSVPSGAWSVLPDIPGYSDNEGYGNNDAGFAVGTAYGDSTSVGWVWDPTMLSYSFLTVPGAAPSSTYPGSINDKGQIFGLFYDTNGVEHGFLKEGEIYTTIDAPGAGPRGTNGIGINNNGTMVGQYFDPDYASQGFVLTSGGFFTTVDYPGPEMTSVNNINDRGDICGVYWHNPSGAERVFLGLRP